MPEEQEDQCLIRQVESRAGFLDKESRSQSAVLALVGWPPEPFGVCQPAGKGVGVMSTCGWLVSRAVRGQADS